MRGRTKGSLSDSEREALRSRMQGNTLGKRKHSEETKEKLRQQHLGKKLSEEHKEKLRAAHLGKKMSQEAIAKTVVANIGRKNTAETRLKMSASTKKGENHPDWKGGVWATEHKRIRKSVEYKLWREAVFLRDNFTCQKTGEKGGKLHPHHILNFSDFPELRFDVDNGVTLSEDAHKEFHKRYGSSNNTKEQLMEFLTEEKQTDGTYNDSSR